MILLNDDQMQEFIVKGFVTLRADFPRSFHESIRSQAESIFAIGGNPGNDILPRVPELAELFAHPAVTGALTSILGPCYAMHAHRHCHVTPPNRPAQRHHQDSYEDDRNVRHRRTRWALAFYYSQDVSAKMGPTSVLPASQCRSFLGQNRHRGRRRPRGTGEGAERRKPLRACQRPPRSDPLRQSVDARQLNSVFQTWGNYTMVTRGTEFLQ